MSNHRIALGVFTVTALATSSVLAAPVTLPLKPEYARVGLTGYAFGLTGVSGQFHDFNGSFTVDPANVTNCTVDLTLQAKSLEMSLGPVTNMVLAPDFLDPDKYPTLVYHGTCKANPDGGALPVLDGTLTMHGETHPFFQKVLLKGQVLTTTGSLKRDQWDVKGDPTMIGNEVKVSVTITLPDSVHMQTQQK